MRIFVAYFVAFLALACLGVRLVAAGDPAQPKFTESLRIAYVGGLSGTSLRSNQEMEMAARDYLKSVNDQGGLAGARLELVSFDDGNDQEKSKNVARQIASDPTIVAVIGHNYSNSSVVAGPIYAEAGIPAVTPASTSPQVTQNNPWYFRTIYSDDRQGRFLVYYAAEVMEARSIVILTAPSVYADTLSSVIRAEARQMEIQIAGEFRIDPFAADAEERMQELGHELARVPSDAVIMMASHQKPATALIKAIRDSGSKLRILGSDSIGFAKFSDTLAKLPRELAFPGYYTNNLFVSVPFLPDAANSEARRLCERLIAKMGPLQNWGAPFAYDAAKVIVEAMRRANIERVKAGNFEAIKAIRVAIRDQLAQMRTPNMGVMGATGNTWFDADGGAMKSVAIGQFSGNLMSALVQLHPSKVGDGLLRVPVVYSGVKLIRVDRISGEPRQLDVEFDLWFRFQGTVPVEEIDFAGAVKPVALGQPIKSSSTNGIEYRLYRIKARLQTTSNSRRAAQGRLGVGITFFHRSLSAGQVIFVPDTLAFPATSGKGLVDVVGHRALLPDAYELTSAALVTDEDRRSTEGDPQLIQGGSERIVAIPGLFLDLELSPKISPLRRRWMGPANDLFALTFAAAFAAILVLIDQPFLARRRWCGFLLMCLATAVMLLTAEGAVIRLWSDLLRERWIGETVRMFDFLWWIAIGCLALSAVERLAWRPLEKRTGRSAPKIIKTVVFGVVILLTTVGVIGNVLEHDITGLMATSGVLAMVLGLAVQSNVANVVSGVSLNMERSIRPGDWVKVGDFPVAEVMDMSMRSTKVRTLENTIVTIPNAIIMGARLENYSHPERYYLIERKAYCSCQHDPRRVVALLEKVLCIAPAADGRQKIVHYQVMYHGAHVVGRAEYVLRFDCIDRQKEAQHEAAVLLEVDRAMSEAGMPISFDLPNSVIVDGPIK
ncbi:branched-chain amino acid transport system substrate-binding protein [Azospirillaceae bacterium]